MNFNDILGVTNLIPDGHVKPDSRLRQKSHNTLRFFAVRCAMERFIIWQGRRRIFIWKLRLFVRHGLRQQWRTTALVSRRGCLTEFAASEKEIEKGHDSQEARRCA